MKKSKLLLIASLAILSISACKKDKDASVQNPISVFPDNMVDVYLAGNEANENGIFVAKYWKNGVPVTLTNGNFNALAYYIFISGADIYVCGTEENQNGKTVAKYWKNGNEVVLSDGTQNATAFSIAVVNNNVYVSGGNQYATCWINGVATTLPDGAFGNEIAVSGNDIYIGGRNKDIYMKPLCWKNGQLHPLNDTSVSHCTASKAVGNDLYLAGYQNTNGYMAKYWKNGNPVIVDSSNSVATGIDISGSQIYVSGFKSIYQDTSWISQAGYWKNNVYTLLANNARTNAVSRFNNHLYICGYVNNKGTLWIDDIIFFTTERNGGIVDVKVVPK